MAPSSSRPRLLNPSYKSTRRFTQFRQLPAEIRFGIWEQSLCYERYIRLHLLSGSSAEAARKSRDCLTLDVRRSLRSFRKNKSFLVAFDKRQERSALFSVCFESRKIALRFYRVHIPCYYRIQDRLPIKGTFCFHTELDIVEIYAAGQLFFPTFAYMFWKHDPKGVGLLHVVMSQTFRIAVFDPLRAQLFYNTNLLRQALSRLQTVIFDLPTKSVFRPPQTTDESEEVRFGRSLPHLASISKFERQTQAPIPKQKELNTKFRSYSDPRELPYRWFRMLEEFGVESSHSVDYRFMIACGGLSVANRQKARRSREGRTKLLSNDGGPSKTGSKFLPIYGFWLFPINAFGPIPANNNKIQNYGHSQRNASAPYLKHRQKWDLSNQVPQHCLQRLPDIPEDSGPVTHMEDNSTL